MSSLKINTISNFIGQSWGTLLNFLLVPVYINFLGIEAYGLIGLFVSLQVIVSVLDLGLSTTVNREVARYSGSISEFETKSLAKTISTLQYIYWGFALAVIAGFAISSKIIATSWITSTSISQNIILKAVVIFGITVGLRWPVSFYSGILRGLEKQVKLNTISVLVLTLKGVGTIILLIFVSRSILLVLGWQLVCAGVEVMAVATIALKSLPTPIKIRGSFYYESLRSVLGFSATIACISILAVAIKQIDKIIISKLLPLSDVGYYNTAFQAYAGIQLFITPVSTAVFPRLSSIVRAGTREELSDVYHKTAKIIAFTASPIAAIFIFNSREILYFWTRSTLVAENAALPLAILACASLFNSVMQASYVLQLASDLQKIALANNIIAFVIFTPLSYLLIKEYGIIGGATSWATFNMIYYSTVPYFTHRYVLHGEMRKWYCNDTLPFIVISLLIFGSIRLIFKCHDFYLLLFLSFAGGIFYICLSFLLDKSLKDQFSNLVFVFTKRFS